MENAKSGRLITYVPEKLYEEFPQEDLPERTKIITEIAVRFQELGQIDNLAPTIFMEGLLRVARISPDLLWTTLSILAGNSLSGVPLSALAKEKNCTKQNIHQTQKRNLRTLHKKHPEIASVIANILGRTNWKKAAKKK